MAKNSGRQPLVLELVESDGVWKVLRDGTFFTLGMERDAAINEALRRTRDLVEHLDPAQFRFEGVAPADLAAGVARLRAWIAVGGRETDPEDLVSRFREVEREHPVLEGLTKVDWLPTAHSSSRWSRQRGNRSPSRK